MKVNFWRVSQLYYEFLNLCLLCLNINSLLKLQYFIIYYESENDEI